MDKKECDSIYLPYYDHDIYLNIDPIYLKKACKRVLENYHNVHPDDKYVQDICENPGDLTSLYIILDALTAVKESKLNSPYDYYMQRLINTLAELQQYRDKNNVKDMIIGLVDNFAEDIKTDFIFKLTDKKRTFIVEYVDVRYVKAFIDGYSAHMQKGS